MTEFVELFAFSNDLKQVVLIRKADGCKHPHLRGRLCGVGGAIEDRETHELAAEREFLEETGVGVPAPCWVYIKQRTTMAGKLTCLSSIMSAGAVPYTRETMGEEVWLLDVADVLRLAGPLRLGPGCLEDMLAARDVWRQVEALLS